MIQFYEYRRKNLAYLFSDARFGMHSGNVKACLINVEHFEHLRQQGNVWTQEHFFWIQSLGSVHHSKGP